MKTILLDCDGVLCDFVGGILDTVNNFSVKFVREDIKHLDLSKSLPAWAMNHIDLRCKQQPGWCRGLSAVQGAYPFMKRCQCLGETHVVTAPWNTPFWFKEREAWLTHSWFDRSKVHFVHDKSLIRGDALVEDSVPNLLAWANKNPTGLPILINQPWNQEPAPNCIRAANLQHAGEILEKYL